MKTKNIPRIPLENLTCKGKIPHRTIIEAITARDAAEKRYPGRTFNIYICHHCGNYHIGGSHDST